MKISTNDVEFIMGLKANGLKIDLNKEFSSKYELCNKYCDKKGRFPLCILEDQIREDREGVGEFKIHFILFVLDALLCPTMKLVVRRSFLYILEDTAAIKKMNWAELLWSYLVHDIEEFKSNKQNGLSSCILFLIVMTFNLYVKLLFSIEGYHVQITFRSKLYL